LSDAQHRWANRVSANLGKEDLRRVLRTIDRLNELLSADTP
jgi:hypothetical protein